MIEKRISSTVPSGERIKRRKAPIVADKVRGLGALDANNSSPVSSVERIKPRKVSIVADKVRGLDANNAIQTLSYIKNRAAPMIVNLIRSAVANEKNNKNSEHEFVVHKINVGPGGKIKRHRPGSHGRASPIVRGLTKIGLSVRRKI